jgi:hypothetical protein
MGISYRDSVSNISVKAEIFVRWVDVHMISAALYPYWSVTRRRFAKQSVEDNCLVSVAEDSPVEVPADGARKHQPFEIASPRDQILHLIAM